MEGWRGGCTIFGIGACGLDWRGERTRIEALRREAMGRLDVSGGRDIDTKDSRCPADQTVEGWKDRDQDTIRGGRNLEVYPQTQTRNFVSRCVYCTISFHHKKNAASFSYLPLPIRPYTIVNVNSIEWWRIDTTSFSTTRSNRFLRMIPHFKSDVYGTLPNPPPSPTM
ncbi:hypothetical protein EX30DRAFT_256221 [Ascodesmis nigricans]|uniref:Uncharacterized protein n=1 Tax=Ascodesmis nigricans TaxID=341454 RepID=A0A4S2MPS6_9PEZI|nr:hypothetical protein EX30DRAFT_256221 [Ascodesmis nigricans]